MTLWQLTVPDCAGWWLCGREDGSIGQPASQPGGGEWDPVLEAREKGEETYASIHGKVGIHRGREGIRGLSLARTDCV